MLESNVGSKLHGDIRKTEKTENLITIENGKYDSRNPLKYKRLLLEGKIILN